MSARKIDRKSLDFSGFSPIKPSTIASPKNDFGIKERIQIVVKQIQEWHSKWQLAQKRGLAICSSIENSVKRFLTSSSESILYTPELQQQCDNLRIVTSVFEDLIKNVEIATKRIEASLNLPNISEEIVYGKSWNLRLLVDSLKRILDLYRNEFQVKVIVMENITNSSTTTDLYLHRLMWEYPVFADSELDVQILQLKCEFPFE